MAGLVCAPRPGLTPLPSKTLWLGRQRPLQLSLSRGHLQALRRSEHQPR